jgi:superfamily I DNA/RNA helicase
VVALHRAAHLARKNPSARVLLTTFSDALARALNQKLKTLVAGELDVASRIDVKAIDRVGAELYAESFGAPKLVDADAVRAMIEQRETKSAGARFSMQFLAGEWRDVVEPWLVHSAEGYGKVSRLGRKARLSASQREALWPVFSEVREKIASRGETTKADMFARLGEAILAEGKRPYDFAVIDEAQDLGVAEARFLAALGAGQPNALFFAGDLGQRIFQAPFSWKSLGVDVRGRSFTLRVNYRTSHQIRSRADSLLPGAIADVDGNEESRKGTVSVLNGPPPLVKVFDTAEAEQKAVGAWIDERMRGGLRPKEIGVIVRSDVELPRGRDAVASRPVTVTTMHLAKGLEFPAVVVMACDDEVLPQQARIETVTDEADLEEVYNTERHLLYVACTRARDHLLVSGVKPGSEFLADLGA